uniref:RRP15-like protein n=1 Tax=Latimeria chalumnae TaxID=7897 RepID=H3AJ23_LATCH
MAAAVEGSRVEEGKKLRGQQKRKKKKKKKITFSNVSYLNLSLSLSLYSEGDADLGDDSCSSGDASKDDLENRLESGDEGAENAEKESANSGWADAMARILGKKALEKKPVILAKNREREKQKAKEKQERLERKKQIDRKREWEMMCRVKPDIVSDREVERSLQKLATSLMNRGVVQLFNAVRKHQKNVGDKIREAGGSERKKNKLMTSVSKRDFISVLRGKEGRAPEQSMPGKTAKGKQATVKSEDGPAWNILRDDFMMGATMKDWDRESDEGEGNAEREHKAAEDDSGSD